MRCKMRGNENDKIEGEKNMAALLLNFVVLVLGKQTRVH